MATLNDNLLKSLKGIFYTGINNTQSNFEKEATLIVNTICVLSVTVLISVGFLELKNSLSHSYYDFIFAALFVFLILLNYLNKYKLSKLGLIYLFTSAIFIGTFTLDFGDFFKFTIILPLSIYFLLFKSYQTWSFYSLIALVTLYFAFNFLLLIANPAELLFGDIIDYVVFILTVAVFLYTNSAFIRSMNRKDKLLTQQVEYEKAISEFSKIILGNTPDKLEKALKVILKASNASRVNIFEIVEDKISWTHEICMPDVKFHINKLNIEDIDVEDKDFSRWINKFKKGGYISGITSQFPDSERVFLEQQHIKSVLALPIYCNDEWFGFIGFDDVFNERKWEDSHIYLLTTIADMLGLHFSNVRYQNNLSQKNEELASLNATKDKFFSIVAHDLRSPLGSLIGLSDVLIDEVENINHENIKEFSGLIKQSTVNTFDYLNNLLEWSSLQTNNINFQKSHFNINTVINEILELLFFQAKAKNIKLSTSLNCPMEIEADINMIKTVVLNLVSNAIKFSHKGGEVVISVERIDNHLTLTIKDSGVGIMPKQKEKLFSIAESSSTLGTDKEKGTGLGLILCKEFISLHNGTIDLLSEVNKGTSFIVKLPI